jgi:hypothetical protein
LRIGFSSAGLGVDDPLPGIEVPYARVTHCKGDMRIRFASGREIATKEFARFIAL